MARKNDTERTTDANRVAQAAGLSQAEIDRLTEETVEQLLKTGGGEAQEWIDKGRIIDAYVERLQPDGKFTKPNPFAILAEREDIPWRASQLRTYRDAFLLWKRMGGDGEAAKVDVTTIGLALSLDHDDAKDVVKRAAREGLTTRQVAALVKKKKGVEAGSTEERVVGDWKVLGKAADSLKAELSLMLDCPSPASSELKVVEKLEVVLKAIQDLIAKVNTPGWGPR